jgi:hypothetical protein
MISARELRGLGLLSPHRQTRKRRNPSPGSHQKAAKTVRQEAMTPGFDTFQDFCSKFRQILRSPNGGAVISAVRHVKQTTRPQMVTYAT